MTVRCPMRSASAILDRITNDDPDGARQLLDGIDARLSAAARAEWRQRVAWSYYIENDDAGRATRWPAPSSEGAGPWVAEGDWSRGPRRLAAGRLPGARSTASSEAGEAQRQPRTGRGRLLLGEPRCRALPHARQGPNSSRAPPATTKRFTACSPPNSSAPGCPKAYARSRISPTATGGACACRQRPHRDRTEPRSGATNCRAKCCCHQARIGDPRRLRAARAPRPRPRPALDPAVHGLQRACTASRPDPAARYPTPKWTPVDGLAGRSRAGLRPCAAGIELPHPCGQPRQRARA